MIGIKHKSFFSVLLLAKAIKALNDRMAVSPVLPLAGRAPLELGRRRCVRQRLTRGDQRLDLDSVVDRLCYCLGHGYSPIE